ncbi:hypothetical protein [Ruania halotolerans]|uniref:hypothetical protein n=1 Tax=Ruania halotolerans TaxID=2897773 RepID=UPI001E5BEB97|nr:hypothetical protein [Ruania halotolerans]UFU05473.1 hypothetical protein LQF10_13590 [Ruania halotolerans]
MVEVTDPEHVMMDRPHQVHDQQQTVRTYASAGHFKGEIVEVRGAPGAVDVIGQQGTMTTRASEVEVVHHSGPTGSRLRVFEMPDDPESPTYGPVRHDFSGIPRWARTLRTVWIVVLVLAILALNGIYLGEIGANVPLPWAVAMVAAIGIAGIPLLLSIRATRRGLVHAEPIERTIGVFEASGLPMEDEATAAVYRGGARTGAGRMPVVDYTLSRLTRAGFVGSHVLTGFIGYTLAFVPLGAITFGIAQFVPDESWRTVAAVVVVIGQPLCAVLAWHLLLLVVARTRYHSPLKERAAAYYRRPRRSTATWFCVYLLITVCIVWLVW